MIATAPDDYDSEAAGGMFSAPSLKEGEYAPLGIGVGKLDGQDGLIGSPFAVEAWRSGE